MNLEFFIAEGFLYEDFNKVISLIAGGKLIK